MLRHVEPGRHLVLFYDYVEDIVERRAPHRPAHLALLEDQKDSGDVVAAGALGDPPTGAAIVFATESENDVTAFVEQDPYVQAGLVTSWRIVPWTVVVT
jgi:hypothetical protein